MKLIQMPLSKPVDRIVRDYLIDSSAEQGLEKFVDNYIESIFDWKSEKNKRVRRFKWALAQIYTPEEIQQLAKEKLSGFDLDITINQEFVVSGSSVIEKEADICDVFLFGELNLSYGEEMGVGSFDDRDKAQEFANSLDEQGLNHTLYGGGNEWYVVWDIDPSD